MLKLAEKYSSKLKDLIPYIKPQGYAAVAASRRNSPSRREVAADGDINSKLSDLIISNMQVFGPIIITYFIASFIVQRFELLFLGSATTDRRRVGRNLYVAVEDFNEVFDIDNFLPTEQSRKLASLVARLDSALETYTNVYMKKACLEK